MPQRNDDQDPLDQPLADRQDQSGFFIALEECVVCGVCMSEAPQLIHDTGSDYRFFAQPKTEAEFAAVVDAFTVCCVDAIYYGGCEPEVLQRLLDIPNIIPRRNVLNAPKADITDE